MLQGKKVLLGITGGIAAYKSILLTRELIKKGAEVQVILTKDALDFVTPVTLATLSKRSVFSEFVNDSKNGLWNNHVELGKWADLMIIAPATANTIHKLAFGQCDNLLVACYLSATCPVYVAPAMDLDMYAHPTTTENLSKLKSHGVEVIDAVVGDLASGLVGKGRMREPEEIIDYVENELSLQKTFLGKKVLITAGPTFEPIDPVRFIGNRSSGKMGLALATEAKNRGAEVALICGPISEYAEIEGVEVIRIQTAQQMFEAVEAKYQDQDILIMAAAVSDYRVAESADLKIKKQAGQSLQLNLVENPDIAAFVGKNKNKSQLLVGFALETNNEEENAREKLKKKNMELIVLNSLQDQGAGFTHDTNKVILITKDLKEELPLKTKNEVAKDIFEFILNEFHV